MLVYLAALPSVVFAHLAKYAFQSEWAFFAVQAAALFVAALTYVVTFELAVESADKEREQFLSLRRGRWHYQLRHLQVRRA